MKLKIIGIIVAAIIIPWICFAVDLAMNDNWIAFALIIILPIAAIFGIIKAIKHTIWKSKHPYRR